MKPTSYRNPNEAMEYLREIRAFMATIVEYNAVSIATSSTTKVRVINSERVNGSMAVTHISALGLKQFYLFQLYYVEQSNLAR